MTAHSHRQLAVGNSKKATAVRLRNDMSVGEAFALVSQSCVRHIRLNETLVCERRNAEALHQIRVAVRRLRSALTLFKPAISGDEFNRIQYELRWLFAASSDARNLDVFLESELSADQRVFVMEQREDAYDRVIAAMNSSRSRQIISDVHDWSVAGPWRERRRATQAVQAFINNGLDRLWSKVSSSGPVRPMGDKSRHRLRIDVKKLRYALDFSERLHTARPNRRRKFEKNLRDLQDSLGLLHDFVTARALVALNSWIKADHAHKASRRLAFEADRALKRLRKTGPYW